MKHGDKILRKIYKLYKLDISCKIINFQTGTSELFFSFVVSGTLILCGRLASTHFKVLRCGKVLVIDGWPILGLVLVLHT